MENEENYESGTSCNLIFIAQEGMRTSQNLADCIGIGKKQISFTNNNHKKRMASREVMRKTLTKTTTKHKPIKHKAISMPNPVKINVSLPDLIEHSSIIPKKPPLQSL
jgi:hypothetical protein